MSIVDWKTADTPRVSKQASPRKSVRVWAGGGG